MHVDSVITPHNILLRSCWPGRVMKKKKNTWRCSWSASSRYQQGSPLSFWTCYQWISTTRCWVPTSRMHGSENQEVELGTPLNVGQFYDPLRLQYSSQNKGWDVTSVEIQSVNLCSILLPLPPIQVPPLDIPLLSHSWESSLALLLGNPARVSTRHLGPNNAKIILSFVLPLTDVGGRIWCFVCWVIKPRPWQGK